MRPALLVVLLLTASACKSGDGAARREPQREAPTTTAAKSFGEPVPVGSAVSISRLLEKPVDYEGKSLLVEGQVRRNCTVKGCWMELAAGLDKALEGARVTFKDYGFFVPLDSAGASARLFGTVSTKKVSQGEVEHMEAEGATFAHKLPDGSAREVRLVATGVELTR